MIKLKISIEIWCEKIFGIVENMIWDCGEVEFSMCVLVEMVEVSFVMLFN